jgi:multiple sugar transport system substrate-binding protein
LWRAAPLPGGLFAAYGGTFFALPRAADPSRKALAWNLLQWLTLEPAQQLAAFKQQDAFPALLSTHNDAFFDEPIAFLGGQRARQLWREATRHIQAPSVHKHDAFAQEVIDTELDKVLDQDKPVPQALDDAQRLLARRALR